ncbi:MotE family protein [Mesorhizobium sp. CAU 1741]|uniref:MotE family protein n=1 Tax=Mesorhizobium sp. CAU 1741 TaxID=3140366 RepID=UPI00325BF3B1
MKRILTLGSRGRTALTLGAGIVLGALVFGGSPAATQSIPVIPGAPTEGDALDDDIRRFCSNIADAARDRRYALQQAELQTLQKDIDARIVTLEEKRLEYEEWLARRNDFLAKAEDNLVEIYSVMRPDAAAERLAEVDMELAAGILMKLKARQAGVILNEMESEAAATLTGIMASAARKQDPS